MLIARRMAVVAVSLVLALQVLRQGAVDGLSDAAPQTAASFWSGHPDVLISHGMTEIAERTRQGQPVTDPLIAQIFEAGRKAPLAPEPYLVRGVQAQLSGDMATAERAFLAARSRNPVSLPARYFLADQYLRRGDAENGLREIAVLARLSPNGIRSLAPYVAAYARQRAAWPQLRALFRAEPLLEQAALHALAADASNAATVMALATRRGPDAAWLPAMIESLLKAREFEKARHIWASVSGVSPDPQTMLHDPNFADAAAPPPFNWALTSSALGLAERLRGGGLHIIYHGRESGALAAQVVLLPPGRYRLVAPVTGGAARSGGLRWSLWCVSSDRELASRALKDAGAGWVFDVPVGCPAQRLQILGEPSDMPQAVDVTVRSVRISREGAGA